MSFFALPGFCMKKFGGPFGMFVIWAGNWIVFCETCSVWPFILGVGSAWCGQFQGLFIKLGGRGKCLLPVLCANLCFLDVSMDRFCL